VTRAALIGVAHWHVPLMLRGFAAAGLEVAAVWDPDPEQARALAATHGATAFADLDALLDAGGLDCAFVSGPHRDMPRLAQAVLARRLPLSLEKPCARTADEVLALQADAQAAGVPVAVPLVQRFADIGRHLMAIARDDPPLEVAVRFVAGPPARYERWRNAWMLDPLQSGGGAAINLAVHFVDLATLLTGSPVVEVTGLTSAAQHRCAVEDLALLTLLHGNGAVSSVTVGYRFPDAAPFREFRLTMSGRRTYVETDAGGLVVRDASGAVRHVPASFDTDAFYAVYVRRFVDDLRQGRTHETGLAAMAGALAVIEAGYRSAREGRRVAIAAGDRGSDTGSVASSA
jgi:predicted dehydrogenase